MRPHGARQAVPAWERQRQVERRQMALLREPLQQKRPLPEPLASLTRLTALRPLAAMLTARSPWWSWLPRRQAAPASQRSAELGYQLLQFAPTAARNSLRGRAPLR